MVFSISKILRVSLLFFSTFFFLSSYSQSQQKIAVVGLIIDSAKAPLPGVNIAIKGNVKSGTITDQNGRFVIDADTGSELVISFVGYETFLYKVPLKAEANLIVTLTHKAGAEEEVIITAYGRKQRREGLTGSVVTIKPDQLRTPASNLTAALSGQVAGIIGFQSSGQPGFDNANFFVRGVTTFGFRQDPLILIDNIELTADDLARLQVDDIAEFSILKDASATALYGSRGANGVILVNTKRGKAGKPRYNVRMDNSINTPTQNLKFADPITYMNLYNEAQLTRNPDQVPLFDADKIYFTQRTLEGAPDGNPYVYPAVNWLDMLFRKTSNTKKINAGITGGSESTQYSVSASYSNDNGLLKEHKDINSFDGGISFKNYQLRSNVDINLTKTTRLSVDLWGIFNDYRGPITNDANGFATDLYYQSTHSSPVLFPAYYAPDKANEYTQHIMFGNFNGSNPNRTGTDFSPIEGVGYANPLAQMLRGYRNKNTSRLLATVRLDQKLDMITKGLSFSGFLSVNRYAGVQYSMSYNPFYYTIDTYDRQTQDYTLFWLNNRAGLPFLASIGSGSSATGPTEYLDISAGQREANSFAQMQGVLNYARAFGKHDVSSVIVVNRQQRVDPKDVSSFATVLPYRNLTYAGSFRYGYDKRYFAQFDVGYNGSERFAPSNRFGVFPSVSASWMVSNEAFWEKSKLANIVNSLKFRASVGRMGNDAISDQRFFYVSDVNLNNPSAGATFGRTNSYSRPGVTIARYPNPDISWEITKMTNYAIEFTLFNSVDFVGEYWTRNTKGILQSRLIPSSMGLEVTPQGNLGRAKGHGVDLTLNYKKQLGKDFFVSLMSNATYSATKYSYYEEPDYGNEYWRSRNGQYLGQRWGYIAERLFVDDKEALASPTQNFGGLGAKGGDIKYRDVNGDGIIDAADMVPIGLPNAPQIAYGFGVSATKGNFDLSFRFTGQTRATMYMYPEVVSPFIRDYTIAGGTIVGAPTQILKAFADDHWSEKDQNLYALYPRMGTNRIDIANNLQTSTWWLRSGNLLRLKFTEVGYNFSRKLISKVGLQSLRIYATATNLLRFSDFDIWEPELSMNTNANNPFSAFNYPLLKSYNIGINVQF